MRRLVPSILLVLLACSWSIVPSSAAVGADAEPQANAAATRGAAARPDGEAGGEPVEREPSQEDRRLRSELRDLERAWADGGGTFGYPFWEKAGQRWRTREITATMYREYVTGYRDRLVVGCGLIDAVETSSDVARDVRRLVLDACRSRVEALRAQQRWLDELVEGADDTAATDTTARDERIAEHLADATDGLQESWRDARLAMDLAQSTLDELGLDRLAEDAFI